MRFAPKVPPDIKAANSKGVDFPNLEMGELRVISSRATPLYVVVSDKDLLLGPVTFTTALWTWTQVKEVMAFSVGVLFKEKQPRLA